MCLCEYSLPGSQRFWYNDNMKKIIKGALIVVGVLLIFNGLINISDNGMVLSYDITTILAGIGFGLVVVLMNSQK